MKIHRLVFPAALASLALLTLSASGEKPGAPVPTVPDSEGARLYLRQCAPCHGRTGRGDGPDAALLAAPPRNLREGFLDKYSTDDLVKRVRSGQPLELALDMPALKARAVEVEAIAHHLERLPDIDWPVAIRGWEIYAQRCEFCHGPYGRPGPTVPAGVRPPRDLSDPAFQRTITEKKLLEIVRQGHRHMPALTPRIRESDGPALYAFVRLLSPGFETYSHYCAACHGDDGQGAPAPFATAGLPVTVFDRKYFASHDPEQVREAVWHMVRANKPIMPHFRWTLSEDQARAIIVYLKQSN